MIAAGLISGTACWFLSREPRAPEIAPEQHRRIASSVLHTVSSEVVQEVLRIEAEEQKADETVWAKEMLAQECGRTLEQFWDGLNAATNAAGRWERAARLALGELLLPKWDVFQELPHGIRYANSQEARSRISGAEWGAMIRAEFQARHWILEQVEFRHYQFETDATGNPLKSRFYFSALTQNPQDGGRRVQVEGDLVLHWGERGAEGSFPIKLIDATALTIKTRKGAPPFDLALDDEIVPRTQSKIIDPLLIHDLNGDGLPEIILAGRNLVYRNRGQLRFEPDALCKFPEDFLTTALVGDFDGDGFSDFLGKKWEGLFLFKGSAQGTFETKATRVWMPPKPLQKPMVMTCGDIDSDGDLDIFIAQYKEPYDGGATPHPFYDANDGEPACLLFNQGTGEFREGTPFSSFSAKRNRRTYSASFAQLDGDALLDLIVVSDFAGLDFYRNEGGGQFRDLTAEAVVPNSKAFGMAHALNDFNNDGQLDLLMTGMTSPAADRLNALGLWRGDSPSERFMRSEMTHGNRLYLGRGGGNFRSAPLSKSIARSGWSWGCTASDFDNDGWVDVYIANGLESNASVTDYESEYWLHDKYVGRTHAAAGSGSDLYFRSKFSRTRGRHHSYGGYEKNRLFWNRGGQEFFEAGFLMGVAVPEDSRNAVSDDFDGDGRIDLAVMTMEIWPRAKQTLKLYRNNFAIQNWIAFRFERDRGPNAWAGAEVRLVHDGGEVVRQLVTGDSYRSQHAPLAHFGLGGRTRIERVEVRRVGRPIEVFSAPTLNTVHHLPR